MKRKVKGREMIEKWFEKNINREIQIKREELNIMLLDGLDKDKVLRFSQELDLLINKYYSLYIQDKKQQIV
ncbi:aspartyl-phosphate phosphatase Spo0E family protein [Tissierella praeacuta]|uniref:aspartyl-phosphate phosphatase Spo0E family protein n=1 Tax=Tissierella praeacuta TaxID=43131 RepID=UPI0028A5FFFD|nr:aspartyl-phosphate phosphatase Spo0E family protein [Tissierella praeacuta]